MMQVWWATMCIAQSALSFNGLEGGIGLNLVPGLTLDEAIALTPPEKGSRAEAAGQLWNSLLSSWIAFDDMRGITCASASMLAL